jgi:hypothetical protein
MDSPMRRSLALAFWFGFAAVVAGTGIALLPACGIAHVDTDPMRWNFCPAAPQTLSAEAEREVTLRAELARLERALADKEMACAAVPKPEPPAFMLPTQAGQPRPQQTAALRPPPPPPQARGDLDAERWKNKDLSVLEGCWRLGHDTPMAIYDDNNRIVESGCTQNAGRLCFDGNGNGVNEELTVCPSGKVFDCRAPMTAAFSGNSLLAQQPDTPGGCGSMGMLSWRRYTCRRVDDTKALCERRDSVSTSSLEFRR